MHNPQGDCKYQGLLEMWEMHSMADLPQSLSPPLPLPYQNQTQEWRAYSPVLTFINYLRSLPKLPLHAPTAITHMGGFAFTSPDVLPFELVLNFAVFYSFVEGRCHCMLQLRSPTWGGSLSPRLPCFLLKQTQRLLRTIRTCSLNTDNVDRRRSHRNNRQTWPQGHHHHQILILRAKHPRRKYCVSKVQLEMGKWFHPLKGIKRDVNGRFACYQQDWIGGLNSGYRYWFASKKGCCLLVDLWELGTTALCESLFLSHFGLVFLLL
jgi:hypothetical protein